ncbi:uncharacterized protein LOC119102800 [Pollicipes pollicipes]|uniref:uncharacterized protein LOC119102800 n=1 Tax=Pollicipes pollicipes TaxID=41117 RepID=UPI0018855C5E|nr:uncharacterized protein LOC119102800 [Pollicipes pollicipes]
MSVSVAAGAAFSLEAERRPWWRSVTRKYVILCWVCGGLAVLLGLLYVLVYFLLRTHTSSLHYFETIPTYVPACVLIVTGFLLLCFIKRRNRFSYLIKLSGGCCLLSAVLCVVITVTTAVVHINRLQTLTECVFAKSLRTCTCFAGRLQAHLDADEVSYVFGAVPNCEVIHGALFSCLRALFGLSVIGALVCIFSCMLVYQLLSHERKKMYWEQLEMRQRCFFQAHPPFPPSFCASEPWQQWDFVDDVASSRRSDAAPPRSATTPWV